MTHVNSPATKQFIAELVASLARPAKKRMRRRDTIDLKTMDNLVAEKIGWVKAGH